MPYTKLLKLVLFVTKVAPGLTYEQIIRSKTTWYYTGLVVNSELEYSQALEYLYHNPQERLRLGKNAKQYAEQIFGAENAAKQLNPIYHRLMETPKRTRQWSIPDERKITNTIKFRIGFI
ncbi:glycosyltransferase [Nostoc sp.]|uniref:glycosyltransferase n=1 Tax=Nostoc sp. TaxID=1180 RepID=UPI002FFA4C9F